MDSVKASTIWSSTGATPYGNLTGVWCIENQQICLCVFGSSKSDHNDKYSLVKVFDDQGPGFKVHPQWTKTAALSWQSDEQKHTWQFHIYFLDEEGFLAEAQMSYSSSGMQCKLSNLKDTQKIKPDLTSGIMAVIGEGRIKVFITKQDDTAVLLLHSPLSPDTQWTQKIFSILPFLTNIGIEKMECDSYGYMAGEFFRVIVNASPQPLNGCVDGPGQSCSSAAFGLWVAERGELFGRFSEKCGVQLGNATDALGIYNSG